MSLEAYHALRSSLTGAVTRLRNRYLKLAGDHPSTYDLGTMTSSLASLDTTAQHFYTSQEEILEYADETVNTPFNEQEELAAIDGFEDSVQPTKTLITRLMATKQTTKDTAILKAAIEDLAAISSTQPDEDHSSLFRRQI